jgi:hypothetical protein
MFQEVKTCKCEREPVTLLQYGLWPSSPDLQTSLTHWASWNLLDLCHWSVRHPYLALEVQCKKVKLCTLMRVYFAFEHYFKEKSYMPLYTWLTCIWYFLILGWSAILCFKAMSHLGVSDNVLPTHKTAECTFDYSIRRTRHFSAFCQSVFWTSSYADIHR